MRTRTRTRTRSLLLPLLATTLALLVATAPLGCGGSSSGGGDSTAALPDGTEQEPGEPGGGEEQPPGEPQEPGEPGEPTGPEEPAEPEPAGDPVLEALIATAGSYAGTWRDDTLGTSGTWSVDVVVDEAAGTLTATVDVVGLPFVTDTVELTVDLEDIAGPWREALDEDGSFSFEVDQLLPLLGSSTVAVEGTIVDDVVTADFSADVEITELPGFTSAGYDGTIDDGVLDMTFEVVSPAFGDLAGSIDLAPVE